MEVFFIVAGSVTAFMLLLGLFTPMILRGYERLLDYLEDRKDGGKGPTTRF